MATIVIKDLDESVELDRKAMRAITGGRARPHLGIAAPHSDLFNNPLSFNEFKSTSWMFDPGTSRL